MPTTAEVRAGRALGGSIASGGVAVALALAAVHFYTVPRLAAATRSLWVEPDLACAVASSVVAFASGWLWRPPASTRRQRSGLRPLVLWAVGTLLLLALWSPFCGLLALVIAPGLGLSSVRVLLFWRLWRTESRWARRGLGGGG